MEICKKCGSSVIDGAKFCPVCGNQMADAPAEVQPAPQPEPIPQPAPQPVPPQEPILQPTPIPQPQYQQPQYQQPQYQQYPPQQYQQQPQDYPPYGQQAYAPPPPPTPVGPTIGGVYSRAFAVLKAKPIRLWGLSLMFSLLTVLASIFGILPIISVPIVFALTVGMKAIYLDGIHGKEVNSDQLFVGFKSFARMATGMGWMYLWVIIWSLIPIAGIVLGIIKAYSYRFVPYIMMSDPDISGPDALRLSMKQTDGIKGKMFGADIIIVLLVWVVSGVFGLLSMIPVVGILFTVLLFIVSLAVAMFLPLLMGLIEAVFYDEKPAE